MTPESLQMLFALLFGFAVTGSSGLPCLHQSLAEVQPTDHWPRCCSLRVLIIRNTILGRRLEGRRFQFVFLAALIAGLWSLMSGLVLVMTLQACGFLLA